MKTILKATALMFLASASAAYAAAGAASQNAGLLVYLFAGFFAVIIITQLVPAAILLFGMLKGVFSRETRSSTVKSD